MQSNKKQFEDQLQQGKNVIEKLGNKDFTIYYFTLDTKGNPTAGIANIYEHVKMLNELGYHAVILHEKNDYKLVGDEQGYGIKEWLGDEYAMLPHASIEKQELNIGPADIIVIPEIFANIMDQIKTFPCKKVVLSQSYNYLLELLPLGKRWNVDYGFYDVITTSVKQARYLTSLFPSIRTHIVPVSIADYFKPNVKPKQPIVSILSRNQNDAAKIVKAFYLEYPIYKWVTFKELRGLPKKQFAEQLSNSCLAVWVDDEAGFGTFPLEAMESNTPVIGKIPNMVPEWMEGTDGDGQPVIKNNGVWTNTTINLPELIATYMKLWFEDSIPSDLLNSIESSKGQYTTEMQKEKLASVYQTLVDNRVSEMTQIVDSLASQLVEIAEETTKNA
jgi:hypothetical protein